MINSATNLIAVTTDGGGTGSGLAKGIAARSGDGKIHITTDSTESQKSTQTPQAGSSKPETTPPQTEPSKSGVTPQMTAPPDSLRGAVERVCAAFESPLLRSLPVEMLMKIFEGRGGEVKVDLETLAAIDNLLRGKGGGGAAGNTATGTASPAQMERMERIEQWLRVALDNPKIISEIVDRVPVLGAKELAELVEMIGRISTNTGIDTNINTNINTDININTSANLIENLCKTVFATTPNTLLDIVKQIDSSNNIITNTQISSADAQRIMDVIVNRLSELASLKPERQLHDVKQLSPQNLKNDIPPPSKPQPPHIPIVEQIRAEFPGLTEAAVRILSDNTAAHKPTPDPEKTRPPVQTHLPALTQKINTMSDLIEKMPTVDKGEINKNCQKIVTALKNTVDYIIKSQPVELDIAGKIKILDLVRDTISSLDTTLRPIAREERQLPQNFYERVITAPERQVNTETKAAVFTQISAVQDVIRALIDVTAKPEINNIRGDTRPPQIGNIPPVNTFSETTERIWINTENLRAGFQEAFSSLDLESRVSPLPHPRPESAATKSIPQELRQSVDALRTEMLVDVSRALREVFASTEEVRAAAGQMRERLPEDLRAIIEKSPEKLPEVLKTIVEKTPEKIPEILKTIVEQPPEKLPDKMPDRLPEKLLNDLRALIEAENSLSRAVAELEKQVRQGSAEIMEKLKDVLKELNRLQFELSKPSAKESLHRNQDPNQRQDPNQSQQGLDGQPRSPSPADVIRSTALTVARGLESLSLLAAQTRGGADIQQQVIALPVKMGQEWTEVQVKFIKDKRKGGKKAGGGPVSVYLNVAPSGLGGVSAHFDYHPPSRLKLSLHCEKPAATKWFRDHSVPLREALARAGLPGASLVFHSKRPAVHKKDAGGDAQTSVRANTIKNGKIDFKV